jgi:transcriptional regulator with XRE-family HTH domain/molybdate-binding protein
MTGSRLRSRRAALGLTQSDLAARAGVSRQLIAAVEAGRNTPAVDAAIRIAHALDTTADALFAPEPDIEVVPALGSRIPDGALVRVGRVGDRLVAAELAEHGTAGAGWAQPDGTVVDGRVRLLAGSHPAETVVAGCDPALGLAAALLGDIGPRRMLAIDAPTGHALIALANGTVHGITVHERPDAMPAAPVPVVRRHLARWEVGLAVPAASGLATVADILGAGMPIVQREPAASSQQAFLRALAAIGSTTVPPGPVAGGHVDAARRAAIIGAAAVTTAPAAGAFGLAFLPLEVHSVEIWIDERWAALPGVRALNDVLDGAAMADRLRAIGGYDLAAAGRGA